ncbi:hypothetical protein AAHC03_024170 [Spirometra sp. Aus1]
MAAFIKWPESSETEKIKIDQICGGLPPLKNPEILTGQNDLVNLSFLNEPEVLDNLKTRFCDRKEIYTYCGVILIAINPYMDLPIYSTEFMEAYNQNRVDSQHRNEPHIFAVADAALTQLKQFSRDQAVIISGESGAGKTVSAKHVLRYLATIAGAEAHGDVTVRSSTACMRSKVVDSCPLLEALGNAKTVRNDNSSRFGKFLEIGFNRRYRIVEARMRTYLLEKSRVVFQSSDERNYHGFYQLLAAVSDTQCRRSFSFLDQLDLFVANDNSDIVSRYNFVNQGDCGQVDGIDDVEEFKETVRSMESLGFKNEEIEVVFTILAAILHFGNVNYEQTSNEEAFIAEDDAHFQSTLRLLKCPPADSRSALCHRVIKTVDGDLSKPLTPDEARAARDALAKHLYQCMFKWIVKRCNRSLAFQDAKPATKGKRSALGRKAPNDIESGRDNFIGVLDIYGFETFEVNSFEQFCINYANEKLQQRFVFHVFKLEQEEYLREGLEWDFVDFYDNQPCIDLIEGPMGILSLLNDECKMPKASDSNWLARLIEHHLNRSRDFSQSKLGARTTFQVHHFAEVVTYTVAGFVEKNCDRVIREHAAIFERTSNPLLLEMLGKVPPVGNHAGPLARKNDKGASYDGVLRQPTVATQFSDSLKQLLETLDNTTAHYVRCIKPNDQKAAFLLSPQRTVQQLRACGILQTIKISAAGFPTQWSYQDFFDRYRPLLSWKLVNRNDRKETSKLILQKYIPNEHCYRLGKTKIFFSAGVLANMERLRTEELVRAGTLIQAVFRGWLTRQRWRLIRVWIRRLQNLARRWLARKHIMELIQQRQEALLLEERRRQEELTARMEPTCEAGQQSAADGTVSKSEHLGQTSPTNVESTRELQLQREIERLKSELEAEKLSQVAKITDIASLHEEIDKLTRKNQQLTEIQQRKSKIRTEIYEPVQRAMPTVRDTRQRRRLISNLSQQDSESSYACSEPDDIQSEDSRAISPNQAATTTLMVNLQRKCASLDAENNELYSRLEAYQHAFAIAQSRNLANQESLRKMEELIDKETAKKQKKVQKSSAKVQTENDDIEQLQAMLDIQKLVGRRLQEEADTLRAENELYKSQLDKYSEEQRKSISRQMHFIEQDTSLEADQKATKCFQNELTRLTSDNLTLREQLETTNTHYRKVVSAMRYFAEVAYRSAPDVLSVSKSPFLMDAQQLIALSQRTSLSSNNRMENGSDVVNTVNLLSASGLIRCLEGQEAVLIQRLVKDTKPQDAKQWRPLLIGHLIYLLIRGADSVGAEDQVTGILTNTIQAIRTVAKRKLHDTECLVFWLANSVCLLNCLKQYSGEEEYLNCGASEEQQREWSAYIMQNYDLNPFWRVLQDLNVLIFHLLNSHLRERLLPTAVIVGALLEYEPIANLSCQAFSIGGQQHLKFTRQGTWQSRRPHHQRLMNTLEELHDLFTAHGVDRSVLWQFFYQLFFYICSTALNSILLRKDLCNWARGAQIRYNLANLETWLSAKELVPERSGPQPNPSSSKQTAVGLDLLPEDGQPLRDLLNPMIQACQLLQSKKGSPDNATVEAICQNCRNLTEAQIIKLLTMYTPVDGYEPRVPPAFLHAVETRLKAQRVGEASRVSFGSLQLDQSTLLLETGYSISLSVPYRASTVPLGQLELPSELGISNLVLPL